MALLPKVKLKALVSFPAALLDGSGVTVRKDGGQFFFDLNYSDFAPVVSPPSTVNQSALLWNSLSGVYTLAPASFFVQSAISAFVLDNYLSGLNTSNDITDPTNDIVITPGLCADRTNTVMMRLLAATTKQLDVAWSLGSGGGLDTGAVGNNSYHLHVISRPDTGVVDLAFSLSPVAPTFGVNIPAAYTQSRRIFSFTRVAGVNRPYWQDGDNVQYQNVSIHDRTGASAGFAWSLLTLSVPTGLRLQPILTGSLQLTGATGNVTAEFGDARDTAILSVVRSSWLTFVNETDYYHHAGTIYTDTLARIFHRCGVATNFVVDTRGYIDTRGR